MFIQNETTGAQFRCYYSIVVENEVVFPIVTRNDDRWMENIWLFCTVR